MRIKTLCLALLQSLPLAANAATVSYDLTGGAAVKSTYNGGTYVETDETSLLTNAATGLNSLPGFLLNVGDTVEGTVTLNTPLTVPAGSFGNEIFLQLLGSGSGAGINYNETLNFYDNGIQVAAPASWTYVIGSSGILTLGAVSSYSQATAAFTFDQLVFNASITSLFEDSVPVSSIDLTSNEPEIYGAGLNPPAVPSPSTVWLMLSGLGGLGVMIRKRKGG